MIKLFITDINNTI